MHPGYFRINRRPLWWSTAICIVPKTEMKNTFNTWPALHNSSGRPFLTSRAQPNDKSVISSPCYFMENARETSQVTR